MLREPTSWDEIDRDAWEALSADAPLQQTWLWGEVLAATGARVERRAHRDGPTLVQVATRRVGPVAVSLASRAPVPPPGLARSLAPAWPRALLVTAEAGAVPGAVPLVTRAWHAALDLGPEPDAIRRAFNPKLRNKIARAERAGLRVACDRRPADWLLDAERAQARARRYRNWPPELTAAWAALGGPVRLYVARDRDRPIAAMLFLLHGRVATCQIGWSGPEGRRAAAHPLCLWRAILGLRAEGIARIDLGTVNTEDAPGLARFKIATGAEVRPLGPTCLVPPWR